MKRSRLVFWIIFPIISLLIGFIMFFYLDMANGHIIWSIVGIIVFLLFIFLRIFFRDKKIYIRQTAWALLIVGILLIVLFAKPRIIVKQAVSYNNPLKTEVLSLKNGSVEGLYNEDKTVEVYAGIPYAKPPVLDLRWKEPVDIDDWSGVLDCTHFQSMAMQPGSNHIVSSLVDLYAQKRWVPDFKEGLKQEMSEDCLYLNIWRPVTNQTNLPILVYIHGGSLTNGTSAYDAYNGEEMAKTGVIMITIQYRLGVFGYLANDELENESSNHTTGNYGLLDQIKALKWVNDNASYFGGDKDNITIAGESAGSSSVSALCTSPLAKGLFKRAIGESSSLVVKVTPHTFRTMEDAKKTGKDILKEFNCKNISELRKVDANKLVKTKYRNDKMTIDGYALTKSPYQVYLDNENNEEALLNGFNVKESDAFVVPNYLMSPTNKGNILSRLEDVFGKNIASKIYDLYKEKIEVDAFSAFNEIISIYWFIQPHYSWSNLAYNNGVKVYKYQFTKENGYYGNYHSGELIYAYGNVSKESRKYRYNDSDIELSNSMLKYWSNFCKIGDPNSNGLVKWNLFNPAENKLIEFGDKIYEKEDPYLEMYDILDLFMDEVKK